MDKWLFYVGTYTSKDEESIHLVKLDRQSGKLEHCSGVVGIENPSFLVLNRDRTRLYAVSEPMSDESGSAAAFALDTANGIVKLMNEQSAQGIATCHVTLDQSEQFLITVNYGGGNVALFPLAADGSIGPMADQHHHKGSGPSKERQEGPHPHASIIDAGGNYIIVSDLGTDKLVHYRLDREGRKLILHRETTVKPGAGPRHFAFNQDSSILYVANELDSTVAVYCYDAADSKLAHLQTVSALPEQFAGENTCADIHLSADGNTLYVSNRGHDSIASYRVAADGRLQLLDHTPTGGRTPRNFALSPDGAWLVAANQQSNSLVVFRIDPQSGRLQPSGQQLEVQAPVCIKFA